MIACNRVVVAPQSEAHVHLPSPIFHLLRQGPVVPWPRGPAVFCFSFPWPVKSFAYFTGPWPVKSSGYFTGLLSVFQLGCWVFDVGCWMFQSRGPVVLSFRFQVSSLNLDFRPLTSDL